MRTYAWLLDLTSDAEDYEYTEGPDWVCPRPDGTNATCTLMGSIDAGKSPEPITLLWKAPSPGGFSILVSSTVSGAGKDPDVTHNTATVTTTVLP